MHKDFLIENFKYTDGELYWKNQAKPWHKISNHAGCKTADGYDRVGYEGKYYMYHRLIWTRAYGAIPKGLVIDHINGNKKDNRLVNLRAVTPQKNQHNRHTAKGYSWCKRDKRFITHIKNNGIKKHIGSFRTECGARLAYLFAKLTRTLTT